MLMQQSNQQLLREVAMPWTDWARGLSAPRDVVIWPSPHGAIQCHKGVAFIKAWVNPRMTVAVTCHALGALTGTVFACTLRVLTLVYTAEQPQLLSKYVQQPAGSVWRGRARSCSAVIAASAGEAAFRGG
jgi:hypothetical protein